MYGGSNMHDPVVRLGYFLLAGGLLALAFLVLSVIANALDKLIDKGYINSHDPIGIKTIIKIVNRFKGKSNEPRRNFQTGRRSQ